MSKREDVVKELKRIIATKDHLQVEEKCWQLITAYPWNDEILLLLCQIFESDWHFRHEDLALSFQYIKNPLTAKSLFNVAFSDFEYQKWNDNYPLQRKCTWALADIGTEEAKEYLKRIANASNKTISAFAKKRLLNWELEVNRKGQALRNQNRPRLSIKLEKYLDSVNALPKKGQRIIANSPIIKEYSPSSSTSDGTEQINHEFIVVYQAYKISIANYAVENQKLGGPDFSYSRMSWIKPNFLWMMYRCGWAEKENQERVLAMWITKEAFTEILTAATFTSFQPAFFRSEEEWRNELETKTGRLQWDPDPDWLGEKMDRRAIQLGLKGDVLKKFGTEQIELIIDITDFVKEQKSHIDHNRIEKLLVPVERVISLGDEELMKRIGIDE